MSARPRENWSSRLGVILAVSVIALLISRSVTTWLEYRGNLIPKLLYWPVSQGVIFLVTVLSFR